MLTPSGPTGRTYAAGAKASGCPARALSASSTSSRWLSNWTAPCDASVHNLRDGGPLKPLGPHLYRCSRGIWMQHSMLQNLVSCLFCVDELLLSIKLWNVINGYLACCIWVLFSVKWSCWSHKCLFEKRKHPYCPSLCHKLNFKLKRHPGIKRGNIKHNTKLILYD